jgi:curved DNA-binding protein CbpA
MYFHSETALFNACRTLFGKEVKLSQEFLNYLQPSGAKSAFRHQAKAHHPDAYAGSSSQICRQQSERFREIRQAYDLITDFLEKRQLRHRTISKPTSQTTAQRGRGSSYRQQQKPYTRTTSIPSIPLEFGMYSYYKGKVTYQQLIEALVWQRRQRPTLGALALKWGWLSEAKVEQILGHRGHAVRFGKKAVELGYLRSHQVDALLQHQRSLQHRIGQYFIDRGLLTEEDADKISQSLKNHNSQLGKRTRSFSNGGF